VTLNPQDVARLFAYTRWATEKTLDSVAPLTPEEFHRALGGSFGSIQGTLAHVYGADWVWLERWRGRSPSALPEAQQVPTFDALREKWREVQDAHAAYVEALTPEKIKEKLTYKNFKGEMWTYTIGDVVIHVANHGTYHRGQIATLLRQLGKPAVSTDYLRFLDAGAK
jgi:uncharacterized damage-inducible protein DinB